jgi:hypothetical protein
MANNGSYRCHGNIFRFFDLIRWSDQAHIWVIICQLPESVSHQGTHLVPLFTPIYDFWRADLYHIFLAEPLNLNRIIPLWLILYCINTPSNTSKSLSSNFRTGDDWEKSAQTAEISSLLFSFTSTISEEFAVSTLFNLRCHVQHQSSPHGSHETKEGTQTVREKVQRDGGLCSASSRPFSGTPVELASFVQSRAQPG